MIMELGYRFDPPAYPHSPGYPGLEINIHASPTRQHYDPETVSLQNVSSGGQAESLTLYHPWPYARFYRICAGRIVLEDRVGKKINFYTFGGELEIKTLRDSTHCRLDSPAPILYLGRLFSIPNILADEVEILLAEKAADCLPDGGAQDQYLSAMDPWVLYVACLHALEDKFQSHRYDVMASNSAFKAFVQNEISILKRDHRYPEDLPRLEEINEHPG
jgi:hypothetical protein